jgi:hypothetical protein
MTIYKLINPDKVIIIVVAPNFYEAIQQAKKTDNYKFTESQYTVLEKF